MRLHSDIECEYPPTFDEMDKAYEETGYKVLLADNHSFYVSKSINDEIEVSIAKTTLNNGDIYESKLNAVNLSIRYLEYQANVTNVSPKKGG